MFLSHKKLNLSESHAISRFSEPNKPKNKKCLQMTSRWSWFGEFCGSTDIILSRIRQIILTGKKFGHFHVKLNLFGYSPNKCFSEIMGFLTHFSFLSLAILTLLLFPGP